MRFPTSPRLQLSADQFRFPIKQPNTPQGQTEGASPCQLRAQIHLLPGPDVKELLAELEVPFSPDQVQWRVTNTTNYKKRGQVVPYANPRAYTDRLNALLSPQGWTRDYKVETMSNITRMKKGESLLSGKVLVTRTVTIIGLWSHSGTGEEWADDDNGMTSADARAFKRACSCFGLGRYFYDIAPIWVDLNQNRQPVRTPVLSAWALPENWREGMRPPSRNGDGEPKSPSQGRRKRHRPRKSRQPAGKWKPSERLRTFFQSQRLGWN